MQIDARGKTCPQPVVMAIKALRQLGEKSAADGGAGAAEELEVLVDERVAVENLGRLAASRGVTAAVTDEAGFWRVAFPPEAAAAEGPASAAGASAPAPGSAAANGDALPAGIVCPAPAGTEALPPELPPTVVIGRNVLGRGNDELGAVLMKGVLYALSQRDEVPRRIIFFNSGAYLTSEGSDALEDIRELERRGTEILTCGTCLDYLGIKERLAVGGVTNLYLITEALMEPGKVVTL